MSWIKNLFNKNKIANKDKTFNSNVSSNIDASDTKIKGNISNTHNENHPNAYYCREIGKILSEAHINFLNAKSKLLNCSKCSHKINNENRRWLNIEDKNSVLYIFDSIENTLCDECKQQIKIMKKNIVDYNAYVKALKIE